MAVPAFVIDGRAALDEFGTGSRASRLVTGTLGIHEWLERELCALTGQPAALAFTSASSLGRMNTAASSTPRSRA